MSECRRFEEEGILLLEKGMSLGEHFDSCPACRAARSAYERLGEQIASAGEHYQPSPFWETRVWAAVGELQKRKRRWGWIWLLPPAGATAAVLVILSLVSPGLTPSIDVQVRTGERVTRRAYEAQPGDRLLVQAQTGGAPYAEIRVYRNGTDLILHCSDDPPCSRQDGLVTAELSLSAIGSYQAVLFTSTTPLPREDSGLDPDAALALEAGARIELGEEVHVR